MMILNALMAAWKTKTTAEKAKMILHGIAMIGGGAIGNTIGNKCSEGKKPVVAFCARMTGGFLVGAVADVTIKQMDETVDAIDGLIQKRKNKEEASDA